MSTEREDIKKIEKEIDEENVANLEAGNQA